jgi:hypothetical protein
MYFPNKGKVVEGHEHEFDHCSMCVYGSALVETYKAIFDRHNFDVRYEIVSSVVYSAPQHSKQISDIAWVNIKKGVRHRITALMDGTHFWCVYADRKTG